MPRAGWVTLSSNSLTVGALITWRRHVRVDNQVNNPVAASRYQDHSVRHPDTNIQQRPHQTLPIGNPQRICSFFSLICSLYNFSAVSCTKLVWRERLSPRHGCFHVKRRVDIRGVSVLSPKWFIEGSAHDLYPHLTSQKHADPMESSSPVLQLDPLACSKAVQTQHLCYAVLIPYHNSSPCEPDHLAHQHRQASSPNELRVLQDFQHLHRRHRIPIGRRKQRNPCRITICRPLQTPL